MIITTDYSPWKPRTRLSGGAERHAGPQALMDVCPSLRASAGASGRAPPAHTEPHHHVLLCPQLSCFYLESRDYTQFLSWEAGTHRSPLCFCSLSLRRLNSPTWMDTVHLKAALQWPWGMVMVGGPFKGTGAPRSSAASALHTPGSAARPRGATAAKPTSSYNLPFYFHREENFFLYKSLQQQWWQAVEEVSALECTGQQLPGFGAGGGGGWAGQGGTAPLFLFIVFGIFGGKYLF